MMASQLSRMSRVARVALVVAATALGSCGDDAPPAPSIRIVAPAGQLIRTTIQTWTAPDASTPVVGPAWIVIRPVAAAAPIALVPATPAPAADRAATAVVDLPEGDYAIDVRMWDTVMPTPAGLDEHALLAVTEPILRAWVPSLSLARDHGEQATLVLAAVALDAPGATDGLARPLVMPIEAATTATVGQRIVLRTFLLDDRSPRPDALTGIWSDSCAPDGASLESTAVTLAAAAFGDDGRARLLARWTPLRAGPCTVAFELHDGARRHRNAAIFQVAAP